MTSAQDVSRPTISAGMKTHTRKKTLKAYRWSRALSIPNQYVISSEFCFSHSCWGVMESFPPFNFFFFLEARNSRNVTTTFYSPIALYSLLSFLEYITEVRRVSTKGSTCTMYWGRHVGGIEAPQHLRKRPEMFIASAAALSDMSKE